MIDNVNEMKSNLQMFDSKRNANWMGCMGQMSWKAKICFRAQLNCVLLRAIILVYDTSGKYAVFAERQA